MILPNDFTQNIKTMIYNNIWNEKRDLIRRDNLFQNYIEGEMI